MEINIEEIDNKLLSDTLSLNPDKSLDEVLEEALKFLVQLRKQENLKKLKGKLEWEKDW